MPFVVSKILYAFFFVILHSYVYKGGDTFLYFAGAKFILSQIAESPENISTFLFTDFYPNQQVVYTDNFKIYYSFRDKATLIMSQITAIITFFGVKSFLATNILFSYLFSFGIWHLFSRVVSTFPQKIKLFAIGILFLPTISTWSSGILKDTITLCAICYLFVLTVNLAQGKKIIYSSILILFWAYICLLLKAYILYLFIPMLLLWTQSAISKEIKNKTIKALIRPLIFTVILVSVYFFFDFISENAGKYSLDNVQDVAVGFQNWHQHLAETKDQSGYSLGEVNFTFTGVLRKAPEAFFVTYYRPTIIEIRNFANLFESLQVTLLLVYTIFILFKVNPVNIYRLIYSNHHIRSFLFFAITMGISVGLTSYNFGALSRYKIPCLVFYVISLILIHDLGTRKKQLSD